MRLLVFAVLVVPRLVLADVPDDGVSPTDAPANATVRHEVPVRHKDIVVTTPGERTTKNIAILASVAGAGVLLGGIGVYYNLDSRSAANDVSAHRSLSVPWTSDRQATYDRAHDSGVKAGIFYGVGGALLVGAAVALIVTQPKDETTVIHPHIEGGPGGATLGGTWSF
jgi:hypothetical protein